MESSTACQLKCPSCPTASGETGRKLGVGFLKLDAFTRFIEENPEVSHIELSNWGEAFLNRDILEIFKAAQERNVAIAIGNGTNLNTVSSEVLEGVVKYGIRSMTCSIDGASQETYEKYRVRGNFERVLANIRTINDWKRYYKSQHPVLYWQFVAFAHNEHEIEKARKLAEELGMHFRLKLAWGDLYGREFSPVSDKDLIRRESGLGVADRAEYRERYGHEYIGKEVCMELWHEPQINYDGRLLGCSINFWGDFGNVFEKGLDGAFNDEAIRYARQMVMGLKPPKEGIPCSTCKIYKSMREHDHWITQMDVRPRYTPSRKYLRLAGVIGEDRVDALGVFLLRLKAMAEAASELDFTGLYKNRHQSGWPRLVSEGVAVPHMTTGDGHERWRSAHYFNGQTLSTEEMTCHASALAPAHMPHPPHRHEEEEILILLSGSAELVLPERPEGERLSVKPGDFVYYPANYPHTLQATGQTAANYLMFKWKGRRKRRNSNLGFTCHLASQQRGQATTVDGLNSAVSMKGQTTWLKCLQGHVSTLQPGAGYPPHVDPYDVYIIVLEGTIETLGRRFEASSVIFCAANEPHGMMNVGESTARYLVFEMHPVSRPGQSRKRHSN